MLLISAAKFFPTRPLAAFKIQCNRRKLARDSTRFETSTSNSREMKTTWSDGVGGCFDT